MIVGIPEARRLLDEAYRLNPGPWLDHSIHTASIARRIAQGIPGLDPESFESFGLLHDIGRRAGITALRHGLDGYLYLAGLGAEENARFCITHTFPTGKIVPRYFSDLSEAEEEFIMRYMENIDIALPDRIVQLSDMLASPYGPMVIEVRVMESAVRNRRGGDSLEFLGICYRVKEEVEAALGGKVYDLFDDLLLEWPKGKS